MANPVQYPIFLAVASGATVSSAGYYDRPERPMVVVVPSHAAIGAWPEWSASSGTAPFWPLQTGDLTGLQRLAVWSGTPPGAGMVPLVPSPYFRIAVSTQTTAVMTMTCLPSAGRW